MCRFACVLLLGFAVSLAAQPNGASPADSRPEIEADVLEGSPDTGQIVGRGRVRIIDAGLLLTADELRYDTGLEKITAAGNVIFTRGFTRLLADELVFLRRDESFTASDIRLGSHPYFVEGESASGTREEIVVSQARVIYGEPSPWQPTVTADMVYYSPGRRLRSENAKAGIGYAQFVPFPRFQQDLTAPFVGHVAFSGGFRRSLGAFIVAGLHVPVAPRIRVGGDLGIYTERGVMFGPSGRYAHPLDPNRMRGQFRSGYINDSGNRLTDLLGRHVPEGRAFAEWQHAQVLSDNLSVSAQLNWWKDSEVLRDFRPDAFFPVQEPDTFVESVYRGPNYFLTAFARLQPNRFHSVQERLPEIRFDLLPLALGNGFFHQAQASAAVLREDPPLGGPRLRSDRLDGYYALQRPVAPRDWFTFTPVAGGRVTHYANTEGAVRAGNYTRLLGEIGADATLRASATFDYQNPRWKVNGLRHLLTPRLGYRYIPEAERGRARIPRIDRQSFSTYLPPLGLGDVRHLDDLHGTNTLRLSLDNLLQTRDDEEGSRDLVALNLANDFRFKRRPGERDLSEVHAELSLIPASWLQVDIYESFSSRSLRFREFNSAVTIRDGSVWSLRFANNFLRNEIHDYSIDARYRFNEVYEALTRLQYDTRSRRFNEQAYGLAQNLGNTWLVTYAVSLYSGRRRESSFGFRISVETSRF